MSAQGIGADERAADSGRRRRPMWLTVVSGAVVALLVAVAAIFAFRADGQPVHDIALTDGGVWVSGGPTGYWGRVNTGAHGFDLVLHGGGASAGAKGELRPDVLQDGRSAVGITSDRRLIAFDSRTGTPIEGELQLPEPSYVTGVDYEKPDLVAMNGNTIAVVDHDTGRIWAKRLDPKGGTPIDDLMDTGELDTVGPNASVTVDLDGDVMAVSADSGTVVEIPAEGEGFGAPERSDLDIDGSRDADITAVGDTWVVLDLDKGEVHVEGLEEAQPVAGESQKSAGVTMAMATLQQPGPASDVVAYQTRERAGYLRVSSDSPGSETDVGVVSGMDDEERRIPHQRISRPVVNGDCLYAAWGDGSAVRWGAACGAVQTPATQMPVTGKSSRRHGVAVRHNRGQLILNDLETGGVYDLSLSGELRIDTWPSDPSDTTAGVWVPTKPAPSTTTRTPQRSTPKTSTKKTG